MSIFLSHSEIDDAAVRDLVSDLETYGKKVWLDKKDLVGGDSWWPEILKEIRTCEVFVFAVSANSLQSDPCSAEFEYARALHRPILPVEIGEVPEAERRNYEVFSGQLVNYRQPNTRTAIALVRALSEREEASPNLPDPLPPEPPTPYEYLLKFGPIIRGRADISRADQETMVSQLASALRREKSASVRASIISLLTSFRAREDDLTAKTARDIDAVLAAESGKTSSAEPVTTVIPEPPVLKQVPGGWYVDPHDSTQLRYWDGSAWTQNWRPVAPPEPAVPTQAQGWYTDPHDPTLLRYWDGSAWTEHIRPGAAVPPATTQQAQTQAQTQTQPPAQAHAQVRANPHQQVYPPVQGPSQGPNQSRVFSILGIVLGLLSLIPWVSIFLGLPALVFGIVALVRRERLGVAALVIAIAGPIVGFVITLVIVGLSSSS